MDLLFHSSWERDDFIRQGRALGEDAKPQSAKDVVQAFIRGFGLKCQQEGYHRQAVEVAEFSKRVTSVGWAQAFDELAVEPV